MNFLKNIFTKKEDPIQSYDDFWNWFKKHERSFYQFVKHKGDVETFFFAKIAPRLAELKDGFFFLTGMLDSDTVELILTADGAIKNFVFVEELVAAAPEIKGWKFTALKPPTDIKNVSIQMAGYSFAADNISFYANEHASMPDEIDITVVHDALTEDNKRTIINGTYIFLDNFIGELNFATTIDMIKIVGKKDVKADLVPIEKLKDFLIWREKEFVEKYEGVRRNTDADGYAMLEAELENGLGLVAVINTELLQWDAKASHPWIVNLEIKYNGEANRGMPDDATFKLLNEIEDEIIAELKDYDGYLNIGRQTAEGSREIYLACNDFRKPSKVLQAKKLKYAGELEMDYNIYKDKYWQSFNRFMNTGAL